MADNKAKEARVDVTTQKVESSRQNVKAVLSRRIKAAQDAGYNTARMQRGAERLASNLNKGDK